MYIHIPFCAHRCDYCDFATWSDRDALMVEYVDACVTDVERRFAGRGLAPVDTVFFGGGTPSLLAPDLLVRILDAIPHSSDTEVTIECNPESTDRQRLERWREHGANRLSFGVQSFVPHVLDSLGRRHDAAHAVRAVELARLAGFERINLDVIYGAAGESIADWEATLDAVVALAPDHVSAYALTVEPGTPLGARVRVGDVAAPDDDDQAAKYELTDSVLGAAGYEWYEISNWAPAGQECRHNLGYWEGGEWLAIGCAAHGFADGRRWWNVRTPERYIDAIRRGASPEGGSESLDDAQRREDELVLGLRTARGVVVPPPARPEAEALAAEGVLTFDGTRAVLTLRGRLLATDVTARLVVAATESTAGTR